MKKLLCFLGLLSILTSCNNIEEVKPENKLSEQVINDETLNRLISKYNLKVGDDLNTNRKLKPLMKFETIKDLEVFLDDRNTTYENLIGKDFENEIKIKKSSSRVVGILKYIDITAYCEWQSFGGSGNSVAIRIQYTIDDQTGRIISVNITADAFGLRASGITMSVSNIKYDNGKITFNLDMRDSLNVETQFGNIGADGIVYSTMTYTPGTTWIYSRFKSFGY
jgi:hypothetical protein